MEEINVGIINDQEVQIRLSIYFDYDGDNHHIQFPHNANRFQVASLLVQLANRITSYNKSGG